ncbi:TetR/AcrR family transcriptional regulator [Klenkia sp. PcliD-1-E]|uniref:TetR/AcrR family transcriptional regulator n=1 Tax=Klenkia sp. PcliD-1-E TaxID=2954492 RepID=UPI0020985EA7|nr:TetR/AcrR family transcriptional regulator [Klenkia sp. PcliD-1-E]MCO7220188.1 TetR/AcrR family transcriptional regulator [Klenkia sp. PcliD-1-E]
MGDEPADRRARKKARTHDEVRAVAQRLFAERGFDAVTVADVAEVADVAVQTVFNHFPTKEDLYFAGRSPWVDGPAHAVADRAPGTGAVGTAHAWVAHHVLAVPLLLRRPAHRNFLSTVQASPALMVQLRELTRRSEERLAAALLADWTATVGRVDGLRLVARLTSGLLITTGRIALVDLWADLADLPVGDPRLPAAVGDARRRSRTALDAVGGGFRLLADRDDASAAFRLVAELERGRQPDARLARRTVIRPPVR